MSVLFRKAGKVSVTGLVLVLGQKAQGCWKVLTYILVTLKITYFHLFIKQFLLIQNLDRVGFI